MPDLPSTNNQTLALSIKCDACGDKLGMVTYNITHDQDARNLDLEIVAVPCERCCAEHLDAGQGRSNRTIDRLLEEGLKEQNQND